MKTVSAWISAGMFVLTMAALGTAVSGADALDHWPANLPPQVPNYAGVNAENFWADGRYRDDNPYGDYVMPTLDPATAIVVDAQNGRDENAGTLAAPFQTLQRAIEAIEPGTVVMIREGTYVLSQSLTLTSAQAGTAPKPVVMTSYPGERVVLTAARPVTTWEAVDGEQNLWAHLLDAQSEPDHWTMLYVDGQRMPNVGQAEFEATGSRDGLRRGNKALEESPWIATEGVWGVGDGRVYLRLPAGQSPAELAIKAVNTGAFALVTLNQAHHVILNRLIFEDAHTLIHTVGSNAPVVRYCILRNAHSGITGSGKNSVEPMFIEHCLMQSNGDFRGRNIYCLVPMFLRYNLITDMPPSGAAVTAYTSTPNQYHNVHIIGNTLLNAGAGIYLVPGTSSVRDNIALASRFVSSSGHGNQVINNFVVCDDRDRGLAGTPRREIGFRMYADQSQVIDNTFIGFDRGMLVRIRAEGPSVFRNNRFYDYTNYAINLTPSDDLSFTDNVFVPAGPDVPLIMVGQGEDATFMDLAGFNALPNVSGNRMESAAAPPLPRVIREAIAQTQAD